MAEKVHRLYDSLITRGIISQTSELLADGFVARDAIWRDPSHPVVGPKAFAEYVQSLRSAYPDIVYEIERIGVSDATHLFVYWHCNGTNLKPAVDALGRQHRPSFHESHISGIDLVTFVEDRSRICEIVTFRQPTCEEKEWLEEEAQQHDPLTIKLERLHYDRKSGATIAR